MDKEAATTACSDKIEDSSTWARDQQKRDYYYDDSHGYEIYNPDDDDDDVEKPEKSESTAENC